MSKKTIQLPTWDVVNDKAQRGQDLTPLEAFIHENEPFGEDREWRALLQFAFEEVLNEG